jgi:uncharacterized protein with HEPN domain
MPSDADNLPRRLLDIIENADAALHFIGDLNSKQFAQDQKTHYAVVRALEIISEASRHLPDELKTRHAGIPWRAIRNAGNVYRHGYLSVSLDVIWETVKRDLPPLREAMFAEFRALGLDPE